jgi:hypothetical protein
MERILEIKFKLISLVDEVLSSLAAHKWYDFSGTLDVFYDSRMDGAHILTPILTFPLGEGGLCSLLLTKEESYRGGSPLSQRERGRGRGPPKGHTNGLKRLPPFLPPTGRPSEQ